METFSEKIVSNSKFELPLSRNFSKQQHMSELRDKILIGAESLFLRYGFKSITMDDVARELGVSKKTLYQFFVDKQDLVNQCVEHYLQHINGMCDSIVCRQDMDAVSIMLRITETMSAVIKQLNPSSMFDLKKYFKSAWDKLEIDRRSFIKDTIKQNLQLGINQGLYRKDLNLDITANIYVYLVGYLTNPDEQVADFDLRIMHQELIKYHLRSICTPAGMSILEEKINSLN